jgi:transcriptional regulator with XRE-family HTH domain
MKKFSQAAWTRLGNAVRHARSVQGLRQRDLAEAMGMSNEVVYAIEKAKRPITVETLWKLEDALGWMTDDAVRVLEGAPAPRLKESDETPEIVAVQTDVTPAEDVSMELDTMMMSILDTWGASAVMRSVARVLAVRKEKGAGDGPNV